MTNRAASRDFGEVLAWIHALPQLGGWQTRTRSHCSILGCVVPPCFVPEELLPWLGSFLLPEKRVCGLGWLLLPWYVGQGFPRPTENKLWCLFCRGRESSELSTSSHITRITGVCCLTFENLFRCRFSSVFKGCA